MIQLRDYQERISTSAAALLREKRICYLSMECRTGKSLTALATAKKLGVKSVLFITKIKAKKSVEDDFRALNPNYELEVINYESVHKCNGKYDLVVCDEAHTLGAYPKPSHGQRPSKRLPRANQCYICPVLPPQKVIRSCIISSGYVIIRHLLPIQRSTNGRMTSFSNGREW